MGNIRSSNIKNFAREFLKEYSGVVTTDFDINKEIVNEYTDVGSKKLRNRIAGYLVILKKNENRIISAPKKEKRNDERMRVRVKT